MIKDIIKKLNRLFKFNRVLQFKMFLGLALLAAVGVQSRMLKDMEQDLAMAQAEWDQVLQTPALEKKLRSKNLKLLKPESQIIAIKNILEGTSFRDEVYQAIIDGEIYSAGDMIGDYKIMNITLRTILLENTQIFDIKELSFPEKEE